MPNITMTEWSAMEARLAGALLGRWPHLRRQGNGHVALCVEAPVLTMRADLDWSHRSLSATVRIIVDRASGCVSGGLLDVAEAVRQMSEVRDAMLFIHGETSGLTVWRDGECPCSYCSGRGSHHGTPCERCGGKGKR